jgi:hypothetical protein
MGNIFDRTQSLGAKLLWNIFGVVYLQPAGKSSRLQIWYHGPFHPV